MAKKMTAAQWAAMQEKPSAPSKKKSNGSGWTKWVAGGAVVATIYVAAMPKNSADASPKTENAAVMDLADAESTSIAEHHGLEALCLRVGKAATKQGITGNDRARLMAISAAESGCESKDNAGLNKDGSVDVCEMQINKTANADLLKGRNWHKLDDCMWMANKVLDRQGWGAWSSYQSGHGPYRKFVPMALQLNSELS